MTFGFTYIQRSIAGRVENTSFEKFDSFNDCCAAAQVIMNSPSGNAISQIQIVPCNFDDHRCIPLLMTVLKTINRPS